MTPHEIHQRDAPRIVESIIRPMLDAGGDQFDVMVMLESVVAGVMVWATKEGSEELVVGVMAESIKERMRDLRAKKRAKNS